MKKGIAFFDFDGTITKQDTLFAFIRFCHGNRRLLWGLLFLSPHLIAFKLHLLSNQRAKEKLLHYFFGGMSLSAFDGYCTRFAKQGLAPLVRPKALAEIKKLQQEGVTIVVVSASPENWIQSWARVHQVDLIASKLQIREGCVTGRINGKNCHGEEKVNRIKQQYCLHEYAEIVAYGDTSGDRPMLRLATKALFRPFR